MKTEVGDKIRFKRDNHGGGRGVVSAVGKGQVKIRLAEDGRVVSCSPAEFTNFSLAARKAWKRMPDRRVGRPKGTTKTDRVSVTLRVDRDVWERFKQAEQEGLISDRTESINACLSEMLAKLSK